MLDPQMMAALQAMIASGDFDDQMGQADMAMQRADLISQPNQRQFSTGVGAGLNAVGDMFRAAGGARMRSKALAQRKGAMDALTNHRAKVLEMLGGGGAPQLLGPGY